MRRLFIGIDLPGSIKEWVRSSLVERALGGFATDGAAGRLGPARLDPAPLVRFVATANYHITLHFLGDTPEDRVRGVEAAMGEAASTATVRMRLRIAGLGTFPGRGAPRVVWAGVEGDVRSLGALHASLRSPLTELGFNLDERRFHPHITLGYAKRGVDRSSLSAFAAELRQTATDASEPFVAEAVTLFESTLTPAGSIYHALSRARLSEAD